MKKAETLANWKQLPDNQPMLKHMTPLAYKSRGSTYGACGIRIDGNPAFVEQARAEIIAAMRAKVAEAREELAEVEAQIETITT